MKIGIDARFAVRKRRGIGNYTLRLIRHLAEIDNLNRYILYIDRNDTEQILPKNSNFHVKKLYPSNYFIWEQVVLPRQAKKDGIDILHCTGNTAPIYMDRQVKLVSSIMDVMYLKDYSVLPKSTSLYQRLGRLYRRMVVPRIIKHLSKVITISNYSKYDIIKYFPTLNEEAIVVIYLATNEKFRVIDRSDATVKIKNKFGIIGSYILSLGGTDPRKNTELVIEKFIELKDKCRIKENLVIVGIPNWKQTKFYDIVNNSLCKKDIIFTDFVSEDELVLLYNCATVFLYPSLYEGFGIPLLEAMACGVPTVTSNVTSMPEIAGNAALLINPRNGEEIKESLLKVLNDKDLRDFLVKRGLEQVKKFSWQRTAQETLELYRSVYNGGNS